MGTTVIYDANKNECVTVHNMMIYCVTVTCWKQKQERNHEKRFGRVSHMMRARIHGTETREVLARRKSHAFEGPCSCARLLLIG